MSSDLLNFSFLSGACGNVKLSIETSAMEKHGDVSWHSILSAVFEKPSDFIKNLMGSYYLTISNKGSWYGKPKNNEIIDYLVQAGISEKEASETVNSKEFNEWLDGAYTALCNHMKENRASESYYGH